MASASIPRIISRGLFAQRQLFGVDHIYSENITDTSGSELAAALRINDRLYAIWAPISPADERCRRVVQPFELTDWSLLDSDDSGSVMLIQIEFPEQEDGEPRVVRQDVQFETLTP